MTYEHQRVDDIERRTKNHLERLAQQVSTVNESDPLVDMVDGIPVVPHLAKFCAEIRKVNRHVKFGFGRHTSWDWRTGIQMAIELCVYMDGHAYAMARVGYGDYSIRTSGGHKYMVYARMIANEKFRDSTEQYHMATAETVERAVKNVKKYLRPYSPMECAAMTYTLVRDRFAQVGMQASQAAASAKYNVLEEKQLRAELFHMLNAGYEFLSQDFRASVVEWRDKINEEQAVRGRALHAYYVNVRLYREEMLCDVIEVLDADKRYKMAPDKPVATYKMEDLPENIAGSLAALSMVEDGHYVHGVGLRVDSTTFWVQG